MFYFRRRNIRGLPLKIITCSSFISLLDLGMKLYLDLTYFYSDQRGVSVKNVSSQDWFPNELNLKEDY
jgi:hypothetical protein